MEQKLPSREGFEPATSLMRVPDITDDNFVNLGYFVYYILHAHFSQKFFQRNNLNMNVNMK